MAEVVYILCSLASCVCAWLLLRAYHRTQMRLLLWSGLCFVGLTLNNALLFVDLILTPTIDLGPLRTIVALGGMASMLYGLIWDAI